MLLNGERAINVGEEAMRKAAIEFLLNIPGVECVVFYTHYSHFATEDSRVTLVPSFVRTNMTWLFQIKENLVSWIEKPPSSVKQELWRRQLVGFIARIVLCIYFTWMALRLFLYRLFPLHYLFPFHQLTEALNTSRFLSTGGGGWINSEFPLTLYENIFLLLVAKYMFGKKYFIVGEQVGPLLNPVDQLLVRWVLLHAEFVGTREELSRRCASALIDGSKCILVVGDMAYASDYRRAREDSTLNACLRVNVNLRNTYYSPFLSEQLQVMRDLISWIVETHSASVHLIPTCSGQHENDEQILFDLASSHVHRNSIHLHSSISTEECQALCKEADLCIGMSYHFCLFSLMANVPTIGIATSPYYEQKLQGLFGLFAANEDVINGHNLRTDKLVLKVHNFVLSRSHRRKSLVAQNNTLRQSVAKNREMLIEVMTEILSDKG